MAYFEVGLNIHLILFLLFNFSFQQLQDCPKIHQSNIKMDAV